MSSNIEQALDSLGNFYTEKAQAMGGEFPIFDRSIPGYTLIAGITDYQEAFLEVIKDETLLSMHTEVKDRIRDGEDQYDAWLEAMTVLYE